MNAPQGDAPQRPLRILQVGTSDGGGGDGSVASALLRRYRARGCDAWLGVGWKTTTAPGVLAFPQDSRLVYRASGYVAVQRYLRSRASRRPAQGWGWISRSLRLVTHPRALVDYVSGQEDFDFPATPDVLELTGTRPDVVHCHNLHGGFFDLRALPWLSRQVPTVLTLHDAWLLSGHCAHSFDCDRWKTGCGLCPDLAIYPAIRRDATAANWSRKRRTYADSRLYISAPSQWLMAKVGESMLAPAAAQHRVIPNGVDRDVFRPADKPRARRELGMPPDTAVIMVTTGRANNRWRDFQTLRRAMLAITTRTSGRVLFVEVGCPTDALDAEAVPRRIVSDVLDSAAMARHYQAADLYVHAAHVDTFPMTVLESLACGTPVVATAVGGIPEQVRPADPSALRARSAAALACATGVLVPERDSDGLADAVVALLADDEARAALAENAVRDVRERFDVNQQVECYLAWYRAIIDDWNHHAGAQADRSRLSVVGSSRLAVD